MKQDYTKFVLSGGSLKGYAYIGFLKHLEELKIVNKVETIVSTSIGSLFALFMLIGYNSKELNDIFMEYEFDFSDNIKLESFITKYGFNDGSKLEQLVKIFLKNKKFDENLTLQQLYNKTKKTLVCTACNINTRETVFFDRITFPNMPCYAAIRASTALPIIFTPYLYEDNLYIDGGISTNIPIKYLIDKQDIYDDILCVTLQSAKKKDNVQIDNMVIYVSSLIEVLLKSIREKHHKQINSHSIKHIEIKISETNSLDFKLSKEEKKKIIDSGYTYTKEFFTQ